MALFIDVHSLGSPVSLDDVAAAVHRESHGLVAGEIYEVLEGA